MDPDVVADIPCTVGEAPLWHPDEDALYWTDDHEGRLYRFDPEDGAHKCVYNGIPFGGFTFQDDGTFLLFLEDGRIENWDHRDESAETIVEELPQYRGSRFNDVIADPEGRVFCGMKPSDTHPGCLYRLDTDGTIRKVVDDLGLPNGMGFTPDHDGFYLTDSDARVIWKYSYDRASGEIYEPEPFVRTSVARGIPDGMKVDTNGHVWSARWNDGRVYRYTPEGAEARRIEFPVWKVSSLTIGGPQYTDAYATTAGGDDREHEGQYAGSLFRFSINVNGVPEFRSGIQL